MQEIELFVEMVRVFIRDQDKKDIHYDQLKLGI